jgi:4,4'-diaponeurosporenoate glycosyltransferase
MSILLAATLLLWAAGFLLLPRLRGCGDDAQLTVSPRSVTATESLSIIIPARNEEHNLPKLLESIAAQSVPPREVLVIDDGSTDQSAAIARRLGATVMDSAPLPDGWRGKTWACHQGAQASSGGLLLFMDADTWFEPGGLARVLATYNGGALSLLPYHALRRPYENLSLFFNLSMSAGTVPDGLAGQFLLVRRAEYQKSGGHESVRGRVLENFRMAEGLRAAGVPLRSANGRNTLSFRMYPDGMSSLIEGWTKGFASGAGKTSPHILLLVVAWMTGLMLPPLALLIGGDWKTWLMTYLLCVGQVAWFARKLGSFHWTSLLFYPLPLMFFFSLFGWSAMRSGKKVTWKGREIHAD